MAIIELLPHEHVQAMRLRKIARDEKVTGNGMSLSELTQHMNQLMIDVDGWMLLPDEKRKPLWTHSTLFKFIAGLGWSRQFYCTRSRVELGSVSLTKFRAKRGRKISELEITSKDFIAGLGLNIAENTREKNLES